MSRFAAFSDMELEALWRALKRYRHGAMMRRQLASAGLADSLLIDIRSVRSSRKIAKPSC